MENIFTKSPQRGDAVVGNKATGKVEYITAESFNPDSLSSTQYEMIGVVWARRGKKVWRLWKDTMQSAKWCQRYEWILGGYTLDGTDRSGVISYRESSSASANTDVTISYNATTIDALVATLNAAFAEGSFATQNWFAWAEDGKVHIGCDYNYWQQSSYNTGKDGFSFTANELPDYPSSGVGLAKCGQMYYPGMNLDRLIAWGTNDNSSTAYNPSSDVTKPPMYPLCLPAYLGTSQYQSDHCAAMRAKYGEGEEGWKRHLRATMMVNPTYRRFGGIVDAQARTELLAGKTYMLADGVARVLCPAAELAMTNPETDFITNWHLPSMDELAAGFSAIKYGTDGSRNADAVNATLWKMGGGYVHNGYGYWSCSRYSGSNAWIFNGNYGFASNNNLYNGNRVLSLSLTELA